MPVKLQSQKQKKNKKNWVFSWKDVTMERRYYTLKWTGSSFFIDSSCIWL